MKYKFQYLLVLLIVITVTLTGCSINFTSGNKANSKYTQDSSRIVAENWVKYNSPTFVFDGTDLQFMQSTSLRCQYAWMYEFKFSAASSGYGNRKGKSPDGQKTNHTIQVVVQKDKVTMAISDDQYDELTSNSGEIIGVDQFERTCQ
ncbi:hypothetical protein KKE14_02355 [Patescibacteria group bacterium]|nr:hypothetical protein [Patescibacteria group bacterium]